MDFTLHNGQFWSCDGFCKLKIALSLDGYFRAPCSVHHWRKFCTDSRGADKRVYLYRFFSLPLSAKPTHYGSCQKVKHPLRHKHIRERSRIYTHTRAHAHTHVQRYAYAHVHSECLAGGMATLSGNNDHNPVCSQRQLHTKGCICIFLKGNQSL